MRKHRHSEMLKIPQFEEVERQFKYRHCVLKACALNSHAIWF